VLLKTVDVIYGIAWFLIVLLFVAAIINFEQGTAGLIARYEFLTVLLAKFGLVGMALAYLRRRQQPLSNSAPTNLDHLKPAH